jgi:hypothetical protein
MDGLQSTIYCTWMNEQIILTYYIFIRMCFSAKASFITFLMGTIFSILLIKYGNPTYKSENRVFGLMLLFISAIQLMDLTFWLDLKNTLGLNKLATIIGPLLNVGQPTILYLIKLLYFKPKVDVWSVANFDSSVMWLNILYALYLLSMYVRFIITDKLVTTTSHGHLDWPWLKYANPYYYLILFAINIFYLTNFNYSLAIFIVTYSMLYLSKKMFLYNIGELWCFFGSFIPVIMLAVSYML